jgi:hypothetical protein
MQLYKFKKILLSKLVTGKETIVTQGYKIPPNALQLLASVDFLYSRGIFTFGSN